jgi:hypothetical protein
MEGVIGCRMYKVRRKEWFLVYLEEENRKE